MSSTATGKEALLAQIEAEHVSWRELLAEIGEERMEQPGPMGDWTFKDLVAHLGGWEHLVPWVDEGGLWQMLADLKPLRLFLDEVDG